MRSLGWKQEHPIVGGACCAAGHRHIERKRKVALHEATSETGYDDTDRWVSTCDGATEDIDVVNNGNVLALVAGRSIHHHGCRCSRRRQRRP